MVSTIPSLHGVPSRRAGALPPPLRTHTQSPVHSPACAPPRGLAQDVLRLADAAAARRTTSAPPPLTLVDVTGSAAVERGCGIGGTRILVWQGSITTLALDGIVNAANDKGLGCFYAPHRCIDNVIHRAAGPRLREACRAAMAQRGYPLASGTAPLVTDAFGLPCRWSCSTHAVRV